MKKSFFVLLVVFVSAYFFASCGLELKECFFENSDITFVFKETSEGKRYGVKYGQKVSIPPIYSEVGQGINRYTAFFSNSANWDVFYFFAQDGTEILTGEKHSQKGFAPLPIKTYEAISDREDRYYGNIFCRGDYYRFNLSDNRVCALFAINSRYYPFGPYKEFVPGCSGYMFKDSSGKWGMCAFQNREAYGRLRNNINKTPLAENRHFDKVIEVVKSADQYVWLACNDKQWLAIKINIGGEDEPNVIEEILVDKKLLSRVLNMKVLDKAKGYKRGLSYVINRNQRVGTKEASVVFL